MFPNSSTHHHLHSRKYSAMVIMQLPFDGEQRLLPRALVIILTFCSRAIYSNQPLTVIPDSYTELSNPKSVAATPVPLISVNTQYVQSVSHVTLISCWKTTLFVSLAQSQISQPATCYWTQHTTIQTPLPSPPLQATFLLTTLVSTDERIKKMGQTHTTPHTQEACFKFHSSLLFYLQTPFWRAVKFFFWLSQTLNMILKARWILWSYDKIS